ncbi:unnamed protein product, partial [Ectocarpus sp. 12 AP-2014]
LPVYIPTERNRDTQTMILNGQVPHLTGFTRAVFSPGDEVELHWHTSMDEVFYAAEGKGTIEVDGTVVQVNCSRR